MKKEYNSWDLIDWDNFFDFLTTAIIEYGSMITIGFLAGMIFCCKYL